MTRPKYAKGQRGTVVSVINEQGHPKYPEIEEHVSRSGTVLDSYPIVLESLPGLENPDLPVRQICYKVRIGENEVVVMEDALDGRTD